MALLLVSLDDQESTETPFLRRMRSLELFALGTGIRFLGLDGFSTVFILHNCAFLKSEIVDLFFEFADLSC